VSLNEAIAMTTTPAIRTLAAMFLQWARLAAPAGAEPADSSAARRAHLVITELGVAATIQGSRAATDPMTIGLNVGYLGRVGGRTMVGGEFAFNFDGSGSTLALRSRLRRELDPSWALNLAAGPILSANRNSKELAGTGLSVAAGLDCAGYVGVSVELQHYAFTDRYSEWLVDPGASRQAVTTTRIGVRVGKGLGLAASLGLGLAALGALASLGN
jgi:hypothetical protein